MRLGLGRMNQIGKFHRVLNEKNGNVVADQIKIALIGIELDRKTSRIAHGVGGSAFAKDDREAHENRRALARLGEQRRSGIFLQRFVAFEISMRSRTARMDHALRYALMVEVGDLFAKNKVLEQRRAAKSRFERVLIVGDWNALVAGQSLIAGINTDPVEWETAWIGPQLRLAGASLLGSVDFGYRAACR